MVSDCLCNLLNNVKAVVVRPGNRTGGYIGVFAPHKLFITASCQGIYGHITPYNRKICLEIINSVLFNNNFESILLENKNKK